MPREQTYLSLILKKQPLGEADELVTVFSEEAGKLRALAKSSRSAKSKLQHGLQVLFLTRIILAGSNLPKLIGIEVLETYSNIRTSLEASKIAFFALELLLKFTADEHKNQKLFNLYLEFFRFLDKTAGDENKLFFGLAKFKINFLENLGFAASAEKPSGFEGPITFSNSYGGFLFGNPAPDSQNISPQTFSQFVSFRELDFSDLAGENFSPQGDLKNLQQIMSAFLEYQLEREIKSERFLNS